MLRRAAVTAAASLLWAISVAAPAQDLPDGPGKSVVQSACSQCHGIDVVISQGRTREEWTDVISRMIGSGAQLSDAEFGQVVDYLSTHFGPPGGGVSAAKSPAKAAPSK